MRHLLIPDKGWPWFGWDWKSQELWIIAAEAGDKPLLEGLRNGWDIHTVHCCDLGVFGLEYPPNRKDPHRSPECVEWRAKYNWQGGNDIRRHFTKTFIYRLNYGGEPRTSGDIPGAKALGLTPARLVAAARSFLTAHPALARWRLKIEKQVQEKHYVKTFTGRTRRLHASGREAIRAAYDYPMQAGGADMFNSTVNAIVETFGDDVRFYWGMHDSQYWGVREEKWDEIVPRMKEIVEREWNISGVRIRIPADFSEYR